MQKCEGCGRPRSTGSARLCRACYRGNGLSEEQRQDVRKWLDAHKIPIDDETREYLVGHAEKRGLTFGEIISRLLLSIADEGLCEEVLGENA